MNPEQQSNNANQQYPAPNTPAGGQGPFTPAGPSSGNKTGLIAAIVVVVVVILGVIAFAMMNSGKKDDSSNNTNNNSTGTGSNTNNSTANSDKYQKYDVTDKPTGLTFSVSFYKDAKVEERNGRTYLNSGEAGSMHSVYLGAATGDKIDCGDSPTTTMRLTGEATSVCYKSDNTQYAGYAKTKSGPIKINLAGQKAISLDEAKAIMESVSFK